MWSIISEPWNIKPLEVCTLKKKEKFWASNFFESISSINIGLIDNTRFQFVPMRTVAEICTNKPPKFIRSVKKMKRSKEPKTW